MELPFAAVQQLCAPILPLAERLPRPQRDALDDRVRAQARGRHRTRSSSRSRFSGCSRRPPGSAALLCVIDDAQWLDRASAQVLGFAARRLAVERIAIVFAAREVADALRGLPEVHVDRSVIATPARSSSPSCRLRSTTRCSSASSSKRAATRWHWWSCHTTWPRRRSPAASACRRQRRSTPGSNRASSGEWRPCRGDARLLALVAASDPTGDAALVWRAAQRLGIPETAAHAAESSGLIAFRPDVAFRHPLVRSAVYRTAAADERTEVHRALAEATDPEPTRIDAPGTAPRQRSCLTRRRRGPGTFRRARASTRRVRRGRRIPRTFGRLDDRPREARRQGVGRRAGEASGRRRRRLGRAARDGRDRPARRDFNGRRQRSFGRESRSPPTAAATRRRSCSRRRDGSSTWTCRWRARPTSTP